MEPVRIAMWSGPRNISTAMMRAWENRADTSVIDEPFYAFYLARTGKAHPGAKEIIACGESDWRKVVRQLTGESIAGIAGRGREDNREISYQKQMTHHLLPEVSRDCLLRVTNCFLIRDPADVIASYLKKNDEPQLEDLGFVQQLEIFNFIRERSERVPPVIDAKDVLQNPERTLRLLCDAVGVEFDPAMLSWPAGRRASDGIWAKYWYAEVERSTSFAPYRKRRTEVPASLKEVWKRCRGCYEQLYMHRLH